MKRRRTTLLSLAALLGTALTALPASQAGAEETEQIRNGTFDSRRRRVVVHQRQRRPVR